jgi:uncharacterized protein YhhL (DUF1145 family)
MPRAVRADPVGVVLCILDNRVIEIPQAIAAVLLVAVLYYVLFHLLPLLFVFNRLPKHQVVNQLSLPRLNIWKLNTAYSDLYRHQNPVHPTVVLA